MPVVKWRLVDTVTGDEMTFEFNPAGGGTPSQERNYSVQRTTTGSMLIYEGADNAQTLQFSGTIISRDHLETFQSWMHNRHVLELIDDLGRHFYVLLQSFQPERVRSALYPWKHTYSMTAQVVEE
jgi:hypothetical protein